MQSIIQTLIPLMLLIALGFVLKKTIANETWTDVLNKLAIYLLFPALIFSGMIKSKLEQIDDFSFIYWNFTILVSRSPRFCVGVYMRVIIPFRG